MYDYDHIFRTFLSGSSLDEDPAGDQYYGAPGLVTTYFVQKLLRVQNFPDFLFTW